MLAAQTGMLIVSALLTLTTYLGAITPLTLLFFTLAVGCGTALNGPAWQRPGVASVGAVAGRAEGSAAGDRAEHHRL